MPIDPVESTTQESAAIAEIIKLLAPFSGRRQFRILNYLRSVVDQNEGPWDLPPDVAATPPNPKIDTASYSFVYGPPPFPGSERYEEAAEWESESECNNMGIFGSKTF